jgi:hypothetical protein
VVEPSENPFYNPALKDELLAALREQATGTDRRHPDSGLQNFASRLSKTVRLKAIGLSEDL